MLSSCWILFSCNLTTHDADAVETTTATSTPLSLSAHLQLKEETLRPPIVKRQVIISSYGIPIFEEEEIKKQLADFGSSGM